MTRSPSGCRTPSQRSFEGTSGELLKHVKPGDPEWKAPKEWPADSRAVTGLLRRLAPAFRKTGWTVDDLGSDNKAKVLRWKILPPEPTETPREDARQSPLDPHHAGGAGMGGDESGPSPSAEQEKNAGPPLCTSCGEPLDQALIDAGLTDHGEDAAP